MGKPRADHTNIKAHQMRTSNINLLQVYNILDLRQCPDPQADPILRTRIYPRIAVVTVLQTYEDGHCNYLPNQPHCVIYNFSVNVCRFGIS